MDLPRKEEIDTVLGDVNGKVGQGKTENVTEERGERLFQFRQEK